MADHMVRFRFLAFNAAGRRLESEAASSSLEEGRRSLESAGWTVESLELIGDSSLAIRPPRRRSWVLVLGILALAAVLASGAICIQQHELYLRAIGRFLDDVGAVRLSNKERPLTVERALAEHRAYEFAGQSPTRPYRVHLGPGWKRKIDQLNGDSFIFQEQVVFGVRTLPSKPGDPEPDIGTARQAFEAMVFAPKKEGEDPMAWLRDQQSLHPITQHPVEMSAGRPWTLFEAPRDENDELWQLRFNGDFLVFAHFPTGDQLVHARELVDTAFADLELPPPSAALVEERANNALQAARQAIANPTAVAIQGAVQPYQLQLGEGWRELPIGGKGGRRFIFRNDESLSFQIEVFDPLASPALLREHFRQTIGRDEPEYPLRERDETTADRRLWHCWDATSVEEGHRIFWSGRFLADTRATYFLCARRWEKGVEAAALDQQLIEAAFAHFQPAPIELRDYAGQARAYRCRLPASWKPIDLSASGFDHAWNGPRGMTLRVEAVAGDYVPFRQPAVVENLRQSLAKDGAVSAVVRAAAWSRFSVEKTGPDEVMTTVYSVTIRRDTIYIVSLVARKEDVAFCAPAIVEALNAVVLP